MLAGCSFLPAKKVPLDAATGFYQAASLTYRLDAGKLQQTLDVARIESQNVRFEQVASSPLPHQSVGTLSVIYPHPGGRAGFAQAKFTLESGQGKPKKSSSWNPFAKKAAQPTVTTSQAEIHEEWVLDVPSAESDQLFKLVCSESFFNNQHPDAVGTQLTVNINGRQVQKNWEQIGELNTLAQRVRRDGQLVSFVRPPTPPGWQPSQITSTKAYSDLLAKTGTPSPAVSPPASAFSMAQPPSYPNTAALPAAPVR
jgi:hypothetical protein